VKAPLSGASPHLPVAETASTTREAKAACIEDSHVMATDEIVAILSHLDERITELRDLIVTQRTVKDWYTTAEAAELLGKTEFTVREWCRHGRVRAQKRRSGRGPHAAWVISHDELLRFQREGLLPFARV
jgi:hypothetical protein